MKKVFISFVIVFAAISLGACASQSIAEDTAPFEGPKPDVAIAEAEKLFAKRVDLDSAREAIKTLDLARNPDKRDFGVEWRFARYSFFLGSRKTIPESESTKVLKKGLVAAKIARRLKPNDPAGYMWFAAILGEQSKRSPVTVGVASISSVRAALEKVIELDPSYQGASAYDGLGQLEMGTRAVGGSVEKAIEYYKKGIELNDENSYLKLHLAEAYISTGKKAEAKKLLQWILDKEPDEEFLAEQKEVQEDAKKLLEKRF